MLVSEQLIYPLPISPVYLGGTFQRKAAKKGNSLTSHNYLHLYTKRRELLIGTSSKHLPWGEGNEGRCMSHSSCLHIRSTITQFNLITNYLKPPRENFLITHEGRSRVGTNSTPSSLLRHNKGIYKNYICRHEDQLEKGMLLHQQVGSLRFSIQLKSREEQVRIQAGT